MIQGVQETLDNAETHFLGQRPAALAGVTEQPKPPCQPCLLRLSVFTVDPALQAEISASFTNFQVPN